jgi:hypothetical protein
MAEIVVENQTCKTCGAGVRPHAAFCYNCGGALAGNPGENESKNGNNKDSDILLTENNKENNKKEIVEKTQIVERNIEIRKFEDSGQTKVKDNKDNKNNKDKKPDLVKEAKLRSAASLRDKAKSFQKKEIEIVWEEPENSSGALLTIIALVLTAFAVTVVILAMYLK